MAQIILAQARLGAFNSISAIAAQIPDDRERAMALLNANSYAKVRTRDPAAATALVQLALDAAKKVQRAPLRDNLLWQIVYHQALNGQFDDAHNTSALIESLQDYDHALYQIVAAQAQGNDVDAARATADSIRPGNWRENAFAIVAGAAIRVGSEDTANKALDESKRQSSFALNLMAIEKAKAGEFEAAMILARKNPVLGSQVFALTKVAEQAMQSGNNAVAKAVLGDARAQALQARKGFQLHDIATVQAKAGYFDDALATVNDIQTLPPNARRMMNGNDVVSALTQIAHAQSKAGRSDEARHTLDRANLFLGANREASAALFEIVRYAARVKYLDLARSITAELTTASPGMQKPPSLTALQIIATELAISGDLVGAASAISEIDETAKNFADDPRRQLAIAQVKRGMVREGLLTVDKMHEALSQVMALCEMATITE